MQSWSVPCSAPGKGSDTLRVTLSIRNTGLALWGVQMQHRDPRSRRAMPPSQAVRSTGTILGRDLFFQAQVTVTLQLTLLFLCAAATVSVCLSVHPWFWLSAGLHRDTGRWLQPQVAVGAGV